MTTGLGPFYDGLAHLFVTPEDLLPVLALSLAAGLRGPSGGRIALFVLPAAWLAGVFVGALFSPHWIWPVVAAGLTVLFGTLAAADLRLSARVVGMLAAALGSGTVPGRIDGAAGADRLGTRPRDRVRGVRGRGLVGTAAAAVPVRAAAIRSPPRGGKLDRGRRPLHAGRCCADEKPQIGPPRHRVGPGLA